MLEYSKVLPLRNSIFQNGLFHFIYEHIFHKIRLTYQHIENAQIWWKTSLKMQFQAFNTVTVKSRKCHIYLAGRDYQQSFSGSFSIARVQIFNCTKKKPDRKQPVEFLIIEHIFSEKSDLSFLKSNLLKAGLYCIILFFPQLKRLEESRVVLEYR